jgi:hypothetical protein
MTSSPEFDHADKTDAADTRAEPQRLEPETRARAEQALGGDLGRVRIHRDPEAGGAADREGARAVTRNDDIYFAGGAYDPATETGQRLLIHELAHTLQQRADARAEADRDALEAEADRAAEAVARGGAAPIRLRAPAGRSQRQSKGKEPAPTTQRHPFELTPTPAAGTVAGGGFSIAYRYDVSRSTDVARLALEIPDGVSVVVTPLGPLVEGRDYRPQDVGGTRARTVVIAVTSAPSRIPRLELTFARGGASYIAVFQFPPGGAKT